MTTKREYSGISTNFGAAEAARTIELTKDNGMDRATSVGFQFNVTRDSGVDYTLTVTVYKSTSETGASYAKVPAYTYASSGAYSADDYSVIKSITDDDSIWVDVDMRNAYAVKVIIESDTASADDAVVGTACSDYNRG